MRRSAWPQSKRRNLSTEATGPYTLRRRRLSGALGRYRRAGARPGDAPIAACQPGRTAARLRTGVDFDLVAQPGVLRVRQAATRARRDQPAWKIGRASCKERVCQYV